MRKILLSLLTLIITSTLFAQELTTYNEVEAKKGATKNLDTVAWVHSGNLVFGINEGILHNWSAGGELASLTLNSVFTGNLTYYHRRSVWSNTLDAAYGLFYAYSNQFIPRKTDDRIDFTSKYGYRMHNTKDFYFVLLANARTQFSKGYNYDVPGWDTFSTSRFLSPLYITLAPGMEYRKGEMLSLFFSPLATRATFVDKYYTQQDPAGAYGVGYDKIFRCELGAYFSTRFQKDFSPNISYKTRLDLYSNYFAKDSYDTSGLLVRKDNPGNIDLMWDNLIGIKVYKYFSLTFGFTAIYDNDLPYKDTYTDDLGVVHGKDDPTTGLGWWQVKQMFTIGFNYKF